MGESFWEITRASPSRCLENFRAPLFSVGYVGYISAELQVAIHR